MEFLDPKKQKQHQRTLVIGYALIALVIGIVLYFLVYQLIGFGIDKNGKIVQNGFIFVSSQPGGATVTVDGRSGSSKTTARLSLTSGTYTVRVNAAGYRGWQRQVTVDGGDVQRFDYPFLFPTVLQTKSILPLQTAPTFTSQSPDHRWLLVKPAGETTATTQYDLNNLATPTETVLNLPAAAYTASDTSNNWVPQEWSSDSKYLLLLHTYVVDGTPAHEYVLLNRSDPTASINITKSLSLTADETLTLFNKKYDQYFVFNKAAGSLRTASIDGTVDIQRLEHVVAYKSYANNTLLYATSQPPTGKAVDGSLSVVLQQGQKTYTLRTIAAGAGTYNLDVTQYNGDWYVVVGSNLEPGVYLYRNPQDQILTLNTFPVTWRYFRLNAASRVNFSSSAQFLLVESRQQFIVYDAENIKTYHYTSAQPIDSPQTYASWMDGTHLTYVSGGKQIIFDYDYQNLQTLQSALPGFALAFDPNYTAVYTEATLPVTATDTTPGRTVLNRTLLTTKQP